MRRGTAALLFLLMPAAAAAQTPPNTPVNNSPLHGAIVNINPIPTPGPNLTSSAFFDPDGQAHVSSQWQVDNDPLFGSVDYDSGFIGDLTTHLIPMAVGLFDNNTYYWRVRYQDANGDISQFSLPTRYRYSSAAEVWAGTFTTNWGNAMDWISGFVPAPGADIIIPAGTPFTVVLDVPRTVGHLFLDTNTLDLAGNALTVNGGFAMQSTLDMTGTVMSVREDFTAGPASTILSNALSQLQLTSTGADQEVRTPGGFFSMPPIRVDGFMPDTCFFLDSFSTSDFQVTDARTAKILADASISGDATGFINAVLEIIAATVFVQGDVIFGGTSTLDLRDGAILDLELGGSFTVGHNFFASTSTGPKPSIISSVTPPFAMLVDDASGSGTLDLTALIVSNVNGAGMRITNDPMVANFANVDFVNNTIAGVHLFIDTTSAAMYSLNNVTFDASTSFNIRTPAGFTGAVDVLSGSGVLFGEPFEDDLGAGVVIPGTIHWPAVAGAPFVQCVVPIGVSTAGGQRVRVLGANLGSATEVHLGTMYPNVELNVPGLSIISNAEIEFTAPALSAGPRFVEVVTPGGQNEILDALTFSGSVGSSSFAVDGGTTPDAYRMKSVPLFAGAGEVTDGLIGCLGLPNPAVWRAFVWDGSLQQYIELPALALNRPDEDLAGRGFFLISAADASCPFTGLATDPAGLFYICLEPGWNIVSLPSPGSVLWSSVRVGNKGAGSTGADDVAANLLNSFISEFLFAWDGTAYMAASALMEGEAYWVYNKSGSRKVLFVSDPLPKAGDGASQSLSPLPADAPQPPAPPSTTESGAASAFAGGGGGGGGGDSATQTSAGTAHAALFVLGLLLARALLRPSGL